MGLLSKIRNSKIGKLGATTMGFTSVTLPISYQILNPPAIHAETISDYNKASQMLYELQRDRFTSIFFSTCYRINQETKKNKKEYYTFKNLEEEIKKNLHFNPKEELNMTLVIRNDSKKLYINTSLFYPVLFEDQRDNKLDTVNITIENIPKNKKCDCDEIKTIIEDFFNLSRGNYEKNGKEITHYGDMMEIEPIKGSSSHYDYGKITVMRNN